MLKQLWTRSQTTPGAQVSYIQAPFPSAALKHWLPWVPDTEFGYGPSTTVTTTFPGVPDNHYYTV